MPYFSMWRFIIQQAGQIEFLYRMASESQDQLKRLTSASVTLVKGYCEAVQIQEKETLSVYGRERLCPILETLPKIQ